MSCKPVISPGTNRPPTSTDYNQQEQKNISNKSNFKLASYILKLRAPSFIV
jgi:hypothetical protein